MELGCQGVCSWSTSLPKPPKKGLRKEKDLEESFRGGAVRASKLSPWQVSRKTKERELGLSLTLTRQITIKKQRKQL